MILFENVVKKYKGTKKPALGGVNLRIDKGEFVFIVGASGSGKSSCLQLMLREEQASSGLVHVLGQNLGKISSRKVPYFRRNLGVVFQDFRLLANKTVFDNVAFSLQVIGKSRGFIQEAVPDVLEMVGLEEKTKRYPHELSGGEQQRVAIARAIVNKPAILLADEPTGNLDPATSLGIMQLLRAINAAGTTVVMATHEAVFVDIMQQRVVELSNGEVVRDEVRGGYGTTAAIPATDLEDGRQQVLRTSEAAVRAALAPGTPVEPTADPVDPDAMQEQLSAESAEVADPETNPMLHIDELAVQEQPDLDDSEHLDDPEVSDHTEIVDRADAAEAPQQIPKFLQPAEEIDPVELAETGGFAKRLGLDTDEDETDVGSVR